MKIAVLGTRGIPNRYSGFEALAENLSGRLVERGHQVRVYCRRAFTRPDDVVDPRIRRVILPGLSNKYFDTLFHTFLSVLHVIFSDAEVILICNVANSPLAWIPRLFGKPTVLNVDGLDRKRRKWNWLGRSFLFLCEMISVFTPTRLVTDAQTVREYYRRRYRKSSTMIAYGSDVPAGCDGFDQFSLEPHKFILYVSRLEPENNPELVLRAYSKVQTSWPLVMVGGNTYNPAYVRYLKSLADSRVIFAGPVYGARYWALQTKAGMYVSACEVGGVHPALVEAMAAGNAIVYLDTPANRETTDGCAVAFRADATDLASKMTELIGDAGRRSALGRKAQQCAMRRFRWDRVTDQYESLFAELLGRTPDVEELPRAA
ncbi:MAG: glycosyltransferase [Terriglobales bacterium]